MIVLTQCDISANKSETRAGDSNRFMPELLHIVRLACVCVRYHSSLLMHECLREHLCEIVPLHPCNCLSAAVRCVLLLRAFFHPLETQCDTAPARTGSLETIRAGQPSAVFFNSHFSPVSAI